MKMMMMMKGKRESEQRCFLTKHGKRRDERNSLIGAITARQKLGKKNQIKSNKPTHTHTQTHTDEKTKSRPKREREGMLHWLIFSIPFSFLFFLSSSSSSSSFASTFPSLGTKNVVRVCCPRPHVFVYRVWKPSPWQRDESVAGNVALPSFAHLYRVSRHRPRPGARVEPKKNKQTTKNYRSDKNR